MKKLKILLLALLCQTLALSGFSQNTTEIDLRPRLFAEGGVTYLGFNNQQVNYLRKVLELKPLYEEKIGEQTDLIANLKLQINLRDSLMRKQSEMEGNLNEQIVLKDQKISLLNGSILKLKQSNRRNFYGKTLYKIATGLLAGTCVYLILK